MACASETEAHRLKSLGGRPSFGWLRERTRVGGNDCAVLSDTSIALGREAILAGRRGDGSGPASVLLLGD